MTDKLIPLRIAGVGYSLPETVITNDDLTTLFPRQVREQDSFNSTINQ